jgi:hypothetical protein
MKSATLEEPHRTACADAVRLAHFDEAVQMFCLPPCSPEFSSSKSSGSKPNVIGESSSAGRTNIDDQIGRAARLLRHQISNQFRRIT